MKLGDKFRLKSGGPVMTVIALNRDDTKGCCAWFPELGALETGIIIHGEPQEKWFHEDVLEKVE